MWANLTWYLNEICLNRSETLKRQYLYWCIDRFHVQNAKSWQSSRLGLGLGSGMAILLFVILISWITRNWLQTMNCHVSCDKFGIFPWLGRSHESIKRIYKSLKNWYTDNIGIILAVYRLFVIPDIPKTPGHAIAEYIHAALPHRHTKKLFRRKRDHKHSIWQNQESRYSAIVAAVEISCW